MMCLRLPMMCLRLVFLVITRDAAGLRFSGGTRAFVLAVIEQGLGSYFWRLLLTSVHAVLIYSAGLAGIVKRPCRLGDLREGGRWPTAAGSREACDLTQPCALADLPACGRPVR